MMFGFDYTPSESILAMPAPQVARACRDYHDKLAGVPQIARACRDCHDKLAGEYEDIFLFK